MGGGGEKRRENKSRRVAFYVLGQDNRRPGSTECQPLCENTRNDTHFYCCDSTVSDLSLSP